MVEQNWHSLVKQLTYARLQDVAKALEFPFFDRGDYNLNLIGIRTDDDRSNLFNDWLCLAFRQNDHEQLLTFSMTTDPGTYYRENPINVDGTAIMVPGHYPGLWEIRNHQGKYPALCQKAPVNVWRDNDRDEVLDYGGEQAAGLFGINLHRASEHRESTQVDRWSAGCQVIAQPEDFDIVMAIARRARLIYSNTFSYTLITEQQLWSA
ncbi:MAG: hypothetical protein AAGI24_04180 [Pseudomonadota bacterium]